jgi:Ni,Fe-hydrogenase I large subunit
VNAVWASLANLHHWLAQDACFPAQCLARWYARGKDLRVPLRALDVLSPDAATQQQQLRLLGQAIASNPDFGQSPQWQGACAETGPWTRLRHLRQTTLTEPLTDKAAAHQPYPPQPVSAWARLEARWQELLEISAAPALADDATHDPVLSSGALALGEGQAIAWCEMARGLLLHWVQLNSHGAVAQYRVLAPTEWNFHPQGALALALAARAPEDTAVAQTLAAAFDPCVECSVAPQASAQEHPDA